MIPEHIELQLHQYKDVYTQLKGALKWKVADPRTLMMVASMYVINKKPFHLNEFDDLSQYIHKNVGIFSTLRSSQRFTTAAMLHVKFDDPVQKFHELKDYMKNWFAPASPGERLLTFLH